MSSQTSKRAGMSFLFSLFFCEFFYTTTENFYLYLFHLAEWFSKICFSIRYGPDTSLFFVFPRKKSLSLE